MWEATRQDWAATEAALELVDQYGNYIFPATSLDTLLRLLVESREQGEANMRQRLYKERAGRPLRRNGKLSLWIRLMKLIGTGRKLLKSFLATTRRKLPT
jgi:hypothetical protein